MNTKQRIAIAVGGIVVVLLVLFPVYRSVVPSAPGGVLTVAPDPPRHLVGWVLSRPTPRAVTILYEVWVEPVPRGLPESVLEDLRRNPVPVPKQREIVEWQPLVRYEIVPEYLAAAVLAVLALTVAAVLVLRTR